MRYDAHAQAIAKGVVESWKTYYAWSRNPYVDSEAIEAFFSVKVAEELFRDFPDTSQVRLETSVSEIARSSGALGTRGRTPSALRYGGRVDVAFFDTLGYPKGVIEVKKRMTASGHRADACRISRMLERLGSGMNGSLRWGALAAMHTIWESNRDEPSAFLKRAAAGVQEQLLTGQKVYESLAEYRPDVPIPYGNDHCLGCAGLCILIR